MFFTYVVRPGDAPEGRAPKYRPFWDVCMAYNLRAGFAIQLISFIGLSLCSLIGGNPGVSLVGILSADSNRLKSVPLPCCLFFSSLWVVGSLLLQGYRQIADDDASIKHSRGFRAGTKFLHQATLLDAFSWIMTAILFYATFAFFDEEWAERQAGSSSMGLYVLVARSVHSLGLLIYSGAIFCLEGYHTEGTVECWAWTITTLFKTAGLLEIACLATSNYFANTLLDVAFTITLGAGLIAACLWACAFEPIVSKYEVKLSQSAMRNEFYKSKNAMAYYGPPIMQGVEMQGHGQ